MTSSPKKVSMYVVLILVMSLSACKRELIRTYDQGLPFCEQELEHLRQESGTEFVFVGRDCICGSTLPAFNSLTIEGKTIDSDYFRGKVNVINFWFETCPPCVDEIPDLNRLAAHFSGQDVNFLAIGRDSESAVREFLKTHPWAFDIVAGRTLVEGEFKIRWGFPTTFVTNKKGVIIHAFGGLTGNAWEENVVPAIAEVLFD